MKPEARVKAKYKKELAAFVLAKITKIEEWESSKVEAFFRQLQKKIKEYKLN